MAIKLRNMGEQNSGSCGVSHGVIDLCDAELLFLDRFIEARTANGLFHVLQDGVEFERRQARLYGKMREIPRLEAWYGDPGAAVTFAGTRLEPKPWTPELALLREKVRHVHRPRILA